MNIPQGGIKASGSFAELSMQQGIRSMLSQQEENQTEQVTDQQVELDDYTVSNNETCTQPERG